MLWVKKQDLKEAVEKKVSTQKLKEHAEELRREGDENYTDIFGNRKLDSKGRARRKIDGSKCMWITYSTRPVERPVNLVVTREMLESLPHTRHFIVTKDRVVKGKLS